MNVRTDPLDVLIHQISKNTSITRPTSADDLGLDNTRARRGQRNLLSYLYPIYYLIVYSSASRYLFRFRIIALVACLTFSLSCFPEVQLIIFLINFFYYNTNCSFIVGCLLLPQYFIFNLIA